MARTSGDGMGPAETLSPTQEDALADCPSEQHARIHGFRREQDGRTFGALERRGLVKRVLVGHKPWQQYGWVKVNGDLSTVCCVCERQRAEHHKTTSACPDIGGDDSRDFLTSRFEGVSNA